MTLVKILGWGAVAVVWFIYLGQLFHAGDIFGTVLAVAVIVLSITMCWKNVKRFILARQEKKAKKAGSGEPPAEQ